MTPIKFIMPKEPETGDSAEKIKNKLGKAVETNEKDEDWYDYGTTPETRKWANVETKDGSMWVWIPRYAYKITQYGSIDIKFLIGKTDYYYDDNGKIKKAQSARTANASIDTTEDYIVHPAFTDAPTNGGWNKELTGIWVAKFEAGYAGGNNNAKQVDSSVNYSNETTNYYGAMTASTKIKYPVFRPTTYSMNLISIQDAYKISNVLTGANNIYGLDSLKADSHLMKNSEWGVVAYLAKSSYGNPSEVMANDITLNNTINTVYAITGCTSNTNSNTGISTTIDVINTETNEGTDINGQIYTWNQMKGQNASTTGNIYGIYDMSGGVEERTAAYISNGDPNLENYGLELKNETQLAGGSTKYVTIYQNTYATNIMIGDAIKETSTSGTGNTSGWDFTDLSEFPISSYLFFARGGSVASAPNTRGTFAFARTSGEITPYGGFRAILVSK